jgi:hypothetical protein
MARFLGSRVRDSGGNSRAQGFPRAARETLRRGERR